MSTDSPPEESKPSGPASAETTLRAQLAAEMESKAGVQSPEDLAQLTTRLRVEAVEIYELCQIAGKQEMAAGFVRQGLAPAAVRKTLLEGRVRAYEAAPVVPVDPNDPDPDDDEVGCKKKDSPLLKAIKADAEKQKANATSSRKR